MSSEIPKWLQTVSKWLPTTVGSGFTANFVGHEEWEKAIISSAITAGLALWEKFSTGFMEELEGGVDAIGRKLASWLLKVVESLPEELKWKLSNFKYRYYQGLIFECRDYETKGLKTKGPFTLDLEKVFVPLRVKPESPGKISANIVQTRKPAEGLRIWDLLVASRSQNAYRSMVIIGAPGSGKTTLLEHLTLTYAQHHEGRYERKAPKLIPILLYLRDVAATIYDSQPTLAALIEQQESISKLNPRPNWFKEKLEQNQCLVMLDGLDEVADKNQRQAVGSWLDRQITDYPKAIFLLTSRPFGYKNASITKIKTVLEVKPFNLKQMEQFINSWYLQNEIVSRLGKDDSGVRQKAQQKANDLIGRIKNNSSLVSMALNPLLLTMIATIHAYRGALPGRRVELYAEICDVLLGRRQDAKGIPDALTADQKKIVLQVLALNLMERGIREFSPQQENSLLEVIQEQLAQVTGDEIKAPNFLEQIEKISGLLVEKEKGVYGFAHKSFQEYLAAVEITKNNQEQILTENISDIWWQETMRLYAAQSDASNLITAALQENTVSALKLALDCVEEGLSIKPEVRQQLTEKLDKGLGSSEPEVFKLAVEVKLAKRLSSLLRIDEDRAIDTSCITWAEYQLFVKDLGSSELRFPGSIAKQPVVLKDWHWAIDFCGWLSEQANSNLILNQQPDQKYYYRLPNKTEIANHLATENRKLEYWIFEKEIEDIVASKGIRLVQTKVPTIFGFDVIKVDSRGREISNKRRYAKYVSEKLGNGIDLDMVCIPGGKFMMGTEDEEIERLCKKYNTEYFRAEKPQHEVTVKPFLMSKFPITQAQYQEVMGKNPSNFKGNDRPVERVSWDDAVEFCRRLSAKTGKEYRLPTEAEWEYAARAGTTSPFYFGETITNELANYHASSIYADEPSGKYREETTAVGSFPPNVFGLYDMHGNVWEWCKDDWHDSYQSAPTDGRAWLGDWDGNRISVNQFSWRKMSQSLISRLFKRKTLSEASSNKVIRSSSCDLTSFSRSAYRGNASRDGRFISIGFRVVCVAPRTT